MIPTPGDALACVMLFEVILPYLILQINMRVSILSSKILFTIKYYYAIFEVRARIGRGLSIFKMADFLTLCLVAHIL